MQKHMRKAGPRKLREDRKVQNLLRELKRRRKGGEEVRSLPAPGAEPFEGILATAVPAPPAVGAPNVLTLLAAFSDVPETEVPGYFDELVYGWDGVDFGALSPSVAHYYDDVSGGAFNIMTADLPSAIQCDPFAAPCTGVTPPGWLPMPQSRAFYKADLEAMLLDAVAAADNAVDFSQYDKDTDGFVDYLIVVHTGTGSEWTDDPNDIPSQTVEVSPPVVVDGVSIDTFVTVPEYLFLPLPDGEATIGVYVHEFGHLLGLPDLYDINLDSMGIGAWGLMGLGTWNGANPVKPRGESPAWLSAWSRVALGWALPLSPADNLSLPGDADPLAPVENGGEVYYLWNEGAANSEFFLIENRQQTGYDFYLPGHGLLVWHIDETMTDNNTQLLGHNDCEWEDHYLVALQQADGLLNLELDHNLGDLSDPYPGLGGKTEFSIDTTPNSGSYSDCLPPVALSNIQEVFNGAEGYNEIFVDLQVNLPTDLRVEDYDSDPSLLPGSAADLTVSLLNAGGLATGVSAVLSSLDPAVTVTGSAAVYPDIPFAETGVNDASPFQVTVSPTAVPGTIVDLQLSVTADGGYADDLVVPVVIGPADVLFVDDDQEQPGGLLRLSHQPSRQPGQDE